MKLRELLSEIKKVQVEAGTSDVFICGGTPRDKVLGRLSKLSDLDLTTGDKTVDYLSQKFYSYFNKKYSITRKIMSDGHSSVYVGNLKVDFSSNFNAPNIETFLKQKGINNPTDMQKEIYSRDFTCNALLMPFDFSDIIDVTKRGLYDIKNKKIVTCLSPDVTLVTNKNRVARAIYLSCKLQFDLDTKIIDYVRSNPNSIKISSNQSLIEKLNSAFVSDPERASYLLTKMGLWNYIPITESIRPYYLKNIKEVSSVTK